MPTHEVNFSSWTAFVDAAEHGETTMSTQDRHSRHLKGRSWAGTKTFEEALELAHYGWPKGAARLKDEMDILVSQLPTRRVVRELHMAPVGPGTLDMNRYIMGHPEPWHTWRDSEFDDYAPNGEIIPITYCSSASAGVSAEELHHKGATIAALVDVLEKAGRRVELTCVGGAKEGYGNSRKVIFRASVKNANDPLDIDRVAFSLAHPATFRRLFFSMMEQSPEEYRSAIGITGYGAYGSPLDDENVEGIYIPASSLYGDSSWSTTANKRAWLKKQLAPYGIDLE